MSIGRFTCKNLEYTLHPVVQYVVPAELAELLHMFVEEHVQSPDDGSCDHVVIT